MSRLYEAISSFARISNDQMDSFVSISLSTVLTGVEEDYHNLNSNEFIRWPGNTVNFDNNVEKELCVIYNDKFECFEPKASAYSENVEKLTTIYGSENCIENSFLDEATDDYIYVTAYNEYETGINIYSNGQIDISLDIRYKCLGSSRFITCEVINGFF